MIVWLKYRQKGAAVGTTTAMRFDALIAEDLPDAATQVQRSLSQIDYVHVLSTRSVWDVAIGADQLYLPAARAFITEWWIGAQKWISFETGADEPDAADFVQVTTPPGRVPLTSTEGHWDLVSFASTLAAKYPDA